MINIRPLLKLFTIATILIIVLSSISFSDVRFVSKTGSSTPPYLTWETASDSIQKCLNICNDGDTVYVANGVYKEFLLINKSIWLLGTSMDSTIINGKDLGDYNTIETTRELHINNFTVIGKGFASGAYYTGIFTTKNNLYVTSCRIEDVDAGLYISSSSGLIDNCIITNVKTGIETFCAADTNKPVISNSMMIINSHGTGAIENQMGGGYLTIIGNIMISKLGNCGIQNDFTIKSWKICNNIISGFFVNIKNTGVLDSSYIVNNILRDDKLITSEWGSIEPGSSNTYIRNNIFSENHIGIKVASPPNTNYNLFWKNDINATNGYGIGPDDIFADPMFVKDTVPNSQMNFDFHLQKYSPAIDKGDPAILDVDGSRSDIGAFGGPYGSVYQYQDLPPLPPKNFTIAYDSLNKVINVTWDKNSASDFSHYIIYRSYTQGFTPDSTNKIMSSDISFFSESLKLSNGKVYYKLTAVDSAGHESYTSEEISVTITGINEPVVNIIGDYQLYQNFPNPFNPTTYISYRLKEEGEVRIILYDIKGELIRVILNETKKAGYYQAEFNAKGLASGIYLYRIEVIGKGNIPVYSNMKKMVFLK
jgi:hypothetical protein